MLLYFGGHPCQKKKKDTTKNGVTKDIPPPSPLRMNNSRGKEKKMGRRGGEKGDQSNLIIASFCFRGGFVFCCTCKSVAVPTFLFVLFLRGYTPEWMSEHRVS